MRGSSAITGLVFAIVFFGQGIEAAALGFSKGVGITFQVPTGWTACDAITITQLRASPPAGRMKTLCSGFDDKGGARMVGSPDGSLVLSFAMAPPSVFPPSYFQKTTQQQIMDQSATLCRTQLHMAPGVAPCTFDFENVAGQRALVGRVSTPNGEFEGLRLIIIPDDSKAAIFIFFTSTPSDETDRRMNEIVASIRVAGEAK